ncbi:MAG: heparinase II/III-family protein [Planctomycetes bacterium]|nr:heparinase II/III-family protein [Planctomycetota bacterium]
MEKLEKERSKGEPLETACVLIDYLRARKRPEPLFSRDYVSMVRERAGKGQKNEACDALEEALEKALVGEGHSNPISAIGPGKFFLAADEFFCEQIARTVIGCREKWNAGTWGNTRHICELLLQLFAVPECESRDIVPVMAWLLQQARAEWAMARAWDEAGLGNSGHNWWLHTFIGFFEVGLYFSMFDGFEKFQAFAPTYFEHEMRLLMNSDGFTRERSGYHWGTARHWYAVRRLAELGEVELDSEFYELLHRVADTEWKTLAPNGDVPRVGDTGSRHSRSSLEHVRVAAALFNMPEAKYVAEKLAPNWTPPYQELLPCMGQNVLSDYRELSEQIPSLPTADTALKDSGYYFMRQNWTPQSDWMCIEAGPLGNIVHSHDHTHVFNIELYSRGRPILIDNCSGPYGGAPERMWRVKSASHNVATIDEQDHIPVQTEWRWEGTVLPHVNRWQTEEKYAYFSGAHEGYRYLPEKVASVRRKIFYLRGQYWIMIDRFTPETEAEHQYTLHFHVNAEGKLGCKGRFVTEGQGGNLMILPIAGAAGEADVSPCPYPIEGYDNPQHLIYTAVGSGPQLFVTLLVPFSGEDQPEVESRLIDVQADDRRVDQWEITGLEVKIAGRRDLYVDQHMQWNLRWKAAEIGAQRRIFHSQCHSQDVNL